MQVKDSAFQELLTSVRQVGEIRRGTRRPSRTTRFDPTDVQAVRAKLGASQAEFALMIGVSVATLRHWEQGRRTPDGPALALLRVAARNPKAVIQALHTDPKRGAA
jgi:putative transcriptional regulator